MDNEKDLGIERTRPDVVVTPGMIEAGVRAFGKERGDDIGEQLEHAYRAMFTAFTAPPPGPPPPPPPPPGQGSGNEVPGGGG